MLALRSPGVASPDRLGDLAAERLDRAAHGRDDRLMTLGVGRRAGDVGFPHQGRFLAVLAEQLRRPSYRMSPADIFG